MSGAACSPAAGSSPYPWIEDFESALTGWSAVTGGADTLTRQQTYIKNGAYSGQMQAQTGINMGMIKLLPATITRANTITVSCWVQKRALKENFGLYLLNSALNGYANTWSLGGSVLYNAAMTNRTTAAAYNEVGASGNLNTWYRLQTVITPVGVQTFIYNEAGTLLSSTPFLASTAYSNFDRIWVRSDNSNVWYVDDITVSLS